MSDKLRKHEIENLPGCAVEFINSVIKKMRYRRKVRQDVQAELIAHFEDELRVCDNEQERQQKAQQLIADFGDVKVLAVLLRLAKKRCQPLWQKVVVRSLQTFGLVFLYLLVCVSPLIIGKPKITIDYIDWLNEHVRADRSESGNARPYYEKAVSLFVEMPQWLSSSTLEWPADFNDVQRQSLVSWLENNQRAFDALRVAAERPYYWSSYQKSGEVASPAGIVPSVMESIMQSLAGYKKLARAMGWRIRLDALSGEIDSAMKDCLVLQKFGDHLHSGGLLVEQLVGIAIEALSFSEITRILKDIDVPANAMKMVQEGLTKQFVRHQPLISLDAEKVLWYDQIQRTFTDDGKGDGRVLMRGLPYVVSGWKDYLWGLVTFSYPSRHEFVIEIDRCYEQIDEFLYRTPWDLHNDYTNENKWNKKFPRSFMLQISWPAYRRVSQLAWRLETHRTAMLTLLAIMRCWKDSGHYPENLNELVSAGYLSSLPMDPFGGRPLMYKKTEEGFILYSVGEDLKDEGGRMGVGGKGQPRMWASNGDWVFWPVPRTEAKK